MDAKELCVMRVSAEQYAIFRHWFKRHGWLIVLYDNPTNIILLASIKPIFSGEIVAIFSKGKGGVSFIGYQHTGIL